MNTEQSTETTAPTRVAIVPASWPNIVFNEQAVERLAEVDAFCESLLVQKHKHAEEIRAEFIEKLDYLNGYGGTVAEDHPAYPARRFQVHIGRDWADKSFSLVWKTRNAQGLYDYGWQGGLIWHGGGNETFAVQLVPSWWGIHT